VIAEMIAVAVDRELVARLGYRPEGFRYVDDYCLFVNSREEAERILGELVKALNTFELQINPSKTRVVEVKRLVDESWTYRIREMAISENIKQQREDIHKFFENLLSLEQRFREESIVKYGLKKIATRIIKKRNWPLYEAYLLKCGNSFPNTLQTITTILSTYDRHGYPLNKKAIARFCNAIIEDGAISDGHSELAWATWLAKELKLRLSKSAVRAIQTSSSSVCRLVCLDLVNVGLTAVKPMKHSLKGFSVPAALYGENWLLSYEGGRRKWLYNKDDNFIRDDPYFSAMLEGGVSFYDERARCKQLFQLKDENQGVIDTNDLFDSDDSIAGLFDFAEDDDEYFDRDAATDDDGDDAEEADEADEADEDEQGDFDLDEF